MQRHRATSSQILLGASVDAAGDGKGTVHPLHRSCLLHSPLCPARGLLVTLTQGQGVWFVASALLPSMSRKLIARRNEATGIGANQRIAAATTSAEFAVTATPYWRRKDPRTRIARMARREQHGQRIAQQDAVGAGVGFGRAQASICRAAGGRADRLNQR